MCSESCSFCPITKHILSLPSRLLHLAIIHEAKDCAKKMIQLSRNEPFLNQQNYQRQVHKCICATYIFKNLTLCTSRKKAFAERRREREV